MTCTLLRWLRTAMATGAVLAVPAFATLTLLQIGGTSTAELPRTDDPIAAGFRVTAPRAPARPALVVAPADDAPEEVVLTAWTFTSKGNPSPWQGGGSATKTVYTGPMTATHNVATTLTCSVTGSNTGYPPGLSATFYVNGTAVGTPSSPSSQSGTTSYYSLSYTFTKAGSYSVYAKYNGDFNDAPSTSSTVCVSVK